MDVIPRFCALPPEARAALYVFLLDLAAACADGERKKWIKELQELVRDNQPDIPRGLRSLMKEDE